MPDFRARTLGARVHAPIPQLTPNRPRSPIHNYCQYLPLTAASSRRVSGPVGSVGPLPKVIARPRPADSERPRPPVHLPQPPRAAA
jgi:hypothetical protein